MVTDISPRENFILNFNERIKSQDRIGIFTKTKYMKTSSHDMLSDLEIKSNKYHRRMFQNDTKVYKCRGTINYIQDYLSKY